MDRPPNRLEPIVNVEIMPNSSQPSRADETPDFYRGATELRQIEPSAPNIELTRREREVIQALTYGWANKRIASELIISQDTVKFHLKSCYRKIGVRNRIEAVSVASRLGVIEFP